MGLRHSNCSKAIHTLTVRRPGQGVSPLRGCVLIYNMGKGSFLHRWLQVAGSGQQRGALNLKDGTHLLPGGPRRLQFGAWEEIDCNHPRYFSRLTYLRPKPCNTHNGLRSRFSLTSTIHWRPPNLLDLSFLICTMGRGVDTVISKGKLTVIVCNLLWKRQSDKYIQFLQTSPF